jgi:hypothetical protein
MPLNEDDEIGKPRDIFYQINPWLELSLGINSK